MHENGIKWRCIELFFNIGSHMIARRCFILLTAGDMTFFLFVPMVSMWVLGCFIAPHNRSWSLGRMHQPSWVHTRAVPWIGWAQQPPVASPCRKPTHITSVLGSQDGQSQDRQLCSENKRAKGTRVWPCVCVSVCVFLSHWSGLLLGAVPTRLQRPCSRICSQFGQKQSSKPKQL